MSKVILHVTAQGPVGSWRVSGGGLESYYAPQASKDDQPAAESMLSLKGNDMSWDVWFDKLTERSPYFINLIQVEAPRTEALSDTLERVQREYLGL